MPSKPKVRCQCGKIRRPDERCACGGTPGRFGDPRRGSAASRGYGSDWSKFRNAYLSLHPLCSSCESQGRVVVAAELHHLIPIRLAPSRRLDPTNCVGLCKRCHAGVTAKASHGTRERGGRV